MTTPSLVEKRMAEVLERELLVVQTDGRAFRGRLVEFDRDFIMLHDCLETSTKDVRWKQVVVPLPTSDQMKVARYEPGGVSYGEKEKKVAVLKKVMINISHVQRIWLWDPEVFNPKEFDDVGAVSL